MKTILRLTVPALLVLLTACRTAPPSAGTPISESASFAEPEGPVEVILSGGLCDLVWRWESPDGGMPDEPDGIAERQAEFQRRFAVLCADTGITEGGQKPLSVECGQHNDLPLVRFPAESRSWERLRELSSALSHGPGTEDFVTDLLVLEVPSVLAREWGLDGFPATGTPPDALAGGMPSALSSERFAALQSLVLAQKGTRVFTTTSTTCSLAKTAVSRQVREFADLPSITVPDTGSRTAPADPQTVKANLSEDACPPGDHRVISYSRPDLRDIGMTAEVCVLPDSIWACIELTDVVGWTVFSERDHIRSPLIASFTIDTQSSWSPGQTLLLGSASRTGRATGSLATKPDRGSCYLLFATIHQQPEPPEWPCPEDFALGDHQLLVQCLPPDFFDSWGEDDDHHHRDEGEEEGSADASPRQIREYLSGLGAEFGSRDKVLYDQDRLICWALPETLRQVEKATMSLDGSPPVTLNCRAAAIRMSPTQWRKLREDLGLAGATGTLLTRRQARIFLGRTLVNGDAEVVVTASCLSLSGKTAILRDVAELVAPKSWDRRLEDGCPQWLPTLDDNRDLGVILEVTPSLRWDGNVGLEIKPEYTEFAGWQPIGPTLGFPNYRSSTVETEVTTECGMYLLLGGGGGQDPENACIVWLVSVDRMGW